MKRARQQAIVAAVAFLLPVLASAQDWQFTFDANGNLTEQTAAAAALPQILGHPQNQVVPPGESASFSVVVADTRGLFYQWRFNGTDIPGATGEALLLQNVSASDEGQYTVVLTNPSGSVTSAPAMLMLDTDSDGLGDSWEEDHFGDLAQFPTADSDGDGVSNATEFQDGTDPTSNRSAVFRLTLLSDGGQVTVTPSRFRFTNGEMVTLTATAFAPHGFHGWSGDVDSTNNPITLTMTNNKTVFAYLSSYDITWVGFVSGDWFARSNWSPRLVPLSNDNVFLTEQSLTTTLNGNAICRSLTLGSSSANPTLTGTGELTVLADSYWVRGTMSGSGRTIVSPNVSLHISSASTHLSGGRTLENGGTILCSGDSFTMGGATITNRVGALFENQTAVTVNIGGVNRFDNAGTFRKSVSSGTATWPVPFNNSGLVEIQTGRLALGNGGTHSGRFEIAAGASLNLSGGTHMAGAASSISGAGDLIVSGSSTTANLDGLVNPNGTHTFSGGTANINGNYVCTNSPAIISGGTANFNSTSPVAVLNLSSGMLGGSGVVNVFNQMNWSGGDMAGSGRTVIAPGALLNLVNAGFVTINTRTLENGGTAIWTGAGNLTGSAAVITNRAGALFELRNNTSFAPQGFVPWRFDNAGTFRKAVAGGTSTFAAGAAFNNYGTAEIQTGTLLVGAVCTNRGAFALSAGATLRLAGGGSASGSFAVPDAALAEWTGNVFTLNSGAQLNGAGLYRINGGTLTINTAAAVENMDVFATITTPGGTALNGAGTVTINRAMNWTSGEMSGIGRTIIAPGATLNFNNPSTVTLNTRTLENGGTTLWTGANISFNTAVITNRAGALFHAQNAAALAFNFGASRFDNAGTFRKSVSAGATTVQVPFNNYGTLDIQTGTLLCSSSLQNNGMLNLSAGTICRMAQGGSASGAFDAAPTALAEWAGNRFTLNSGAQLNGAGLYRINGGTLTINTAAGVENMDVLATITTPGGTALNGVGTVTINRAMNWTSGEMSGIGRTIIASGATLSINNPSTVALAQRTLENGGTALWTGANISFDTAVITNRAGALFHAQNAAALVFNFGASRFDNAGTFRKSGNTGTTTVQAGIPFNNYNTVELRSGRLAASGGYTSRTNSLLNCALGGTTAGTDFGQLQVAGTVNLLGSLSVDLVNSFMPTTNDSFAVLTAGTRNGAFANFYYPSDEVTMQMSNTPNAVVVRVTRIVPPRPTLLQPLLSGTDITLTWTARSNITYQVEFNPDLHPTNWAPLPGDVTVSGDTASKMDVLTSTNRFYRVRVVE